MCEFVICWRVNDGQGNVSILRSWCTDEDIQKIESFRGIGHCWLEEFQEGMDVVEIAEGIDLADM